MLRKPYDILIWTFAFQNGSFPIHPFVFVFFWEEKEIEMDNSTIKLEFENMMKMTNLIFNIPYHPLKYMTNLMLFR